MGDHEECTSQCRSREHGDNLSAIIQCQDFTDHEVASYLTWRCLNYPSLVDKGGRSLAHVAASAGRLDLLRHFLQSYDCLNKIDEESGYTLLHASLFHGQVHCAVRLIQLGANLSAVDNEFLTPFDIVMKDLRRKRKRSVKRSLPIKDLEVYLWGMNANYTLGCGHNRERTLPEPHEFFRKSGIHLVQVAMQKFHTVFVSGTGLVWSCGHGPGGRLGQGTENPSLEPKEMHKPETMACVAAALGDDHTVLLMLSGLVFTCGLNTYSQLGHSPPPPSLLSPKPVRSLSGVCSVAAAQFHSVFCTEKQLYTCGLNGGQLGHAASSDGGNTVIIPKEVTSFKLKDGTIVCAAACPAATVILSSAGAVYLFYNYRCTRLTPRDWLRKGYKVVVTGGNLDPRVLPGGSDPAELKVGLLADQFVFLWRNSSDDFLQCTYSVRRELLVTDFAFGGAGCILSTVDGEAFMGSIRDAKKIKTGEIVDVRRLAHAHRAELVAADPRGRNFTALQVSPLVDMKAQDSCATRRGINHDLAVLLDEAHESDDIHDVIFQVSGRRYPAHSYIVFHSREMSSMKKVLEENKENHNHPKVIDLPEIPVEQFERVLRFIYSGDIVGFPNVRASQTDGGVAEDDEYAKEISAYENYQKKKEKAEAKNEALQGGGIRYVARRLGVAGLTGKAVNHGRSWLERKAGDFDAKLKSLDGTVVQVHKCVLVARLDYFRVMLTHGWREAQEVELRVPVTGRVLEVLVDYMYTDESRDVNSCEDVDFLATVLIAADELLCEGLRLTVEKKLIKLLNLRNAVDFLQLAVTYNAEMVQQYAKRFIATHLTVFLESRSLEVLSDETLMELSTLYRENISPYRRLRSSLDEIEIITVKSVTEAFPVAMDLQGDLAKPSGKEKAPSPRKKDRRERRTSDRQRLISVDSCEQAVSSPSPIAVKEDGPKKEIGGDGWVEVGDQSKASKVVQARLKAIAQSKQEVSPLPQLIPLSRREPEVAQEKNKDLEVSLEKDFPQLSRQRQDKITSDGTPPKASLADVPKKFTKLSQRERRRQLSTSAPAEEIVIPQKLAWAVLPPPQAVIDAQSPPRATHLAAIIDSEQKERERAARMRSKPLALTQLEDRAIHDLMLFYNVAGATEEKITVRRLVAGSVAPPVWVSAHR